MADSPVPFSTFSCVWRAIQTALELEATEWGETMKMSQTNPTLSTNVPQTPPGPSLVQSQSQIVQPVVANQFTYKRWSVQIGIVGASQGKCECECPAMALNAVRWWAHYLVNHTFSHFFALYRTHSNADEQAREYVTCNTCHTTTSKPFRHVPIVSNQNHIRLTIVWFYCIEIPFYPLIVTKTQDSEASLKIYQLICSLPSSLARRHVKTARLRQHRHISICPASVTWSYWEVTWLRHATKLVILLFDSVHTSPDIKFTW